jgi:MarR family transcriptional regulator, lower aerobic nicotinate degradation pathway regulator
LKIVGLVNDSARIFLMGSDDPSEYRPPAAVRVLPSWLLGQAARRAQTLVQDRLAGDELGRQHFTVLASLAEDGPASQADLGRRLLLDRSDMHAIVSLLERSDLILRSGDPADQRRKVVTITSAGRRVLKRLQHLIGAAQDEILAPLEPAEREQLVALLARLGRD